MFQLTYKQVLFACWYFSLSSHELLADSTVFRDQRGPHATGNIALFSTKNECHVFGYFLKRYQIVTLYPNLILANEKT